MVKKFFSSFTLLLTLTLFSFLLVMGGEEKSATDTPSSSPLVPAGLLSSQELLLLSEHFGASVPYFSLSGQGQVEDTNYAGGYARKLTWEDPSGVTVTGVQPPAAAYLLRTDALTPSTESTYLIDGMTAALFTGDNLSELHFGDETAAYCLQYTGSAEELLQLLTTLQFTN